MRLAQLARKLDVRPADITDFLERNNIIAENGLNFRLDDQMVALVQEQFGRAPATAGTEEPNVEPVSELSEELDQPKLAEEVAHETEAIRIEEQEETIEIIKAPKVALPGLRVLGKIDLPEPKPKVQEANDPNVEDTGAAPAKAPLPPKRQKKGANPRARKNPVTVRREREAREAERKRHAEAELEKERRRQKYLSKVKINVPTKAARIYEDEEVEELQPDLREEPKAGLLGRFMDWLFRKA